MFVDQVIDKETALHDIKCLEDAILFVQEKADEEMRKAVDKINSYRERIEELRDIADKS